MMRVRTLTLLLLKLPVFCNISVSAQAIVDADLVFRLGASSAMGDAIAAATDRGEGAVEHVGIFAVIDRVPSVIEATPGAGVTVTPLTAFIAVSASAQASPAIKVMRVEGVDATSVIERALGYVGRPYDFAYMPGDDALYCSELVYECYLDADGQHIFDAAPMNFLSADGSLPDFWRDLFAAIGVDVPQGVPGTNPAAMSASPRLVTVLTL